MSGPIDTGESAATARSRARSRIAAFGAAAGLVYAAFAYAGIRSPDGELMYRTAESILVDGDFAIEPLAGWDFGVAEGRDGRSYAMYGPGLPLLALPAVRVARALVPTGVAPSAIGTSHYVPQGLRAALERTRAGNAVAHAQRRVAACLNVLVAALAAAAFLRVLQRFDLDASSRLIAAAAFAFGTPLLPLSGTFFSEPLQVALLLLALDALLAPPRAATLLASGAFLALAVCVHVAALLWVPFLAGFGVTRVLTRCATGRERMRALAALVLPLALAALALLLFNAVRFGSPLDTGRPAAFYLPQTLHLRALFLAWGKGLFVHSPWIVFGIAGWPLLARRIGVGSGWWLAAVCVPVLAYATFRDWHGGFGPGPRYLLPSIAILCVAAGALVQHVRRSGRIVLSGALAIAIAAQTWVASGDVFLWQHRAKLAHRARGESVFSEQKLYTAFDLSPFQAAYLGEGAAGPALAQWLGVPAAPFWIATTSLLLASLGALVWIRLRRERA